MQVHRQRIHGDDFAVERTGQAGERRRRLRVVFDPWPAGRVMTEWYVDQSLSAYRFVAAVRQVHVEAPNACIVIRRYDPAIYRAVLKWREMDT
jgi:hypothetical protein